MTEAQEQELHDKMKNIGYPDFDVLPGQEQVLMVYVQNHLICSAFYALNMAETTLQALIQETVQ